MHSNGSKYKPILPTGQCTSKRVNKHQTRLLLNEEQSVTFKSSEAKHYKTRNETRRQQKMAQWHQRSRIFVVK